MHRLLGPLALGDVAVNRDKASPRHRVAADLENGAIGALALRAISLVGAVDTPLHYRFDIARTEFAAFSQMPEKFVEGRADADQRVWKAVDFLEISISRDKLSIAVEHRDALRQVLEKAPQLGLAPGQLGRPLVDDLLQSRRRLGAFGNELVELNRVAPEHLDGPRHRRNLVPPGSRHNAVTRTLGDVDHRAAEARQAPHDAAPDVKPHNQHR